MDQGGNASIGSFSAPIETAWHESAQLAWVGLRVNAGARASEVAACDRVTVCNRFAQALVSQRAYALTKRAGHVWSDGIR